MIKLTFKNLLFFGLVVTTFSACINEKKLVYFQKSNNHSDTLELAKAYIPKVQTGDILSIYVSSLNPEASSFFNPYAGTTSTASSAGGSGNSSVQASQTSSTGYLVDPSGIIELPLIGNIKVSGYTTAQVRDTIKTLLKTYLKEPTVLVRFLNFKISILGEVTRPDVYSIPNEMITLPEALSMAGDLTLYARRDSIEIIRDVNGKKEFGYVDLRKRDIFSSPYYYLHANDLIYVKPAKTKAEETDRSIQYVSIGVSLLSILLVVFKK
ncbi:polysaccharide biosynthesis/export family protein [Mucilaginibacter sp. E4BP6]|uniref:polysaccharide biosynthesis/export family protein n=1 Tax=Mucilaginibacter sp. E4BP6 TaxID=2723089 RepID=UPI0015CB1F7E|nr:polysaccharide biosynthesis/export family protein [Mucilaginibacter sp. E4BP6]NYE68258.1 polysaccharide export outer membrane protein [Mucilaginibacter sp. E4BP6]